MINLIYNILLLIRRLLSKDINRLWRKGAIHISTSNWLKQIISILQRILLARIIGAENIGHIAVVRSSMAIFQLPAKVGIFTPTTKLAAENKGNESIQTDILSNAFGFVFCTSCAVSLVSYFVLKKIPDFFSREVQDIMPVVVFLLPFLSLTHIMTSFLAGQQRMKDIANLQISISVGGFFSVLALCYYYEFRGWIIYYVGLAVLSFFIFLYYVGSNITLRYNWKILKKMLSIGVFAFLGQSVGTILLQVDTLSINGIMKNAEATGIYNTAALAYQQLMTVVGGILFTTFPYVAQNKYNVPLLFKRYKELSLKLFFLSFVASICAWIIAPLFFSFFGPEFLASVFPFRILVLGFLCRVQYVLVNCFLDALGRTDLTFITGLMTTICNILLNIMFIPKWGINGAAWATVISLFLTMILRAIALQYFIFYKKAYK